MTAAINATALKAFIARIERLESERAAIKADIDAVYLEAKATGYSPKIMRQVVKLRAKDSDKVAEDAAMLDLYVGAVGFGSLPLGKIVAAVEAAGPRVADVKAKLAEGESVDPETGEIQEAGNIIEKFGEVIAADHAAGKSKMGKSVPITDEERSKGVVGAFKAKGGERVTIAIGGIKKDEIPAGSPVQRHALDVGPEDAPSDDGSNPGAVASASGPISDNSRERGAAHTDEAVTLERHVNAAPPREEMEIPSFLDRRPKARTAEMA